ncbi:hypothetical protein D3C78_621590 [compost metagenome]
MRLTIQNTRTQQNCAGVEALACRAEHSPNDFLPICRIRYSTEGNASAFFKVVVASTVFSGRLFQRLLLLLPLGVEQRKGDAFIIDSRCAH